MFEPKRKTNYFVPPLHVDSNYVKIFQSNTHKKYLVKEMLLIRKLILIRKLKPALNVQSDSICAKEFI